MTLEQPQAPLPPKRWFNWTSAVLIASLALNVFVLSAGAARFFFPPPPDLDRERRKELLAVLRKYARDFRDSRLDARKHSARLADALEAEPYDQQLVAAAIQAYADTGNQLVSHGQKATLDFVAMLSPEERKMMATRLRQRDSHRHRR